MPAPKMLAMLPKPVLFGLYGAIGGLIGALAFGELVWWALNPPKPEPKTTPPPPEPQLAVGASKDLQIYQGGTNKLFVQIARADFNDAVKVRVDGLPPGVSASEITIPASKEDGEIELRAAFSLPAGPGTSPTKAKVIATAKPGGKTVIADAPFTLEPLVSPMPQADIVFVLDVTGSMQEQINGLKNGIGTFAGDLYKAKVDAQFACVAFRDLTVGEPSQVLMFKGERFTGDASAFSTEVGRLRADGGGDTPESSLEAITEAAQFNDYRKNAVRTLVLITDAPPKVNVGQGQSVKTTADSLTNNKIDLLHIVVNPGDLRVYRDVQKGAVGVTNDKSVTDKGREFDLGTTARDSKTFTDRLLPEMTKAITAAAEAKPVETKPQLATRPPPVELPTRTVKSLQSGEESAEGTEWLQVLRSAVWTGVIAGLVCLCLLGGQHHYLRGALPPVGGVLLGFLGGLVVGSIGGAAGQGLFLLANTDNKTVEAIFRVIGWAMLGGLAGVGLSLFIPNLGVKPGLIGGLIGGAVGALGYIAVRAITGEILGRLAGGFALGLCIGLMVAVVEAAFRRAWLEVRYGPREMVTVNLGAEPVKIGGDSRACTVWARGAAPIALRFFVRDGQVICTDVAAREEFAVADGDTRIAGNVTVVVRTGSAPVKSEVHTPGSPNSGLPAPRRAAPVVKPGVNTPGSPKPGVPASAPLSLDDDPLPLPVDDSPLPLPLPPLVAAPVRPPVPATPPRPPVPTAVARPAAAPGVNTPGSPNPGSPAPAAPPAKPATRDPDACPSCGRKNPGRPGTRYCMVCDQTY